MEKLLVVVDYQNDFVDGALGFPGAEQLDEGISNKILNHEGLIIYTLDTHRKDYLNTREGTALPIEHCIEGSKGWVVYGKTRDSLKEKGADKNYVMKETFGLSPDEFKNGSQFQWPGRNEVESIELVGLVTNMCVISNAVLLQANYPEAQIIVDASLCASFDNDLHEKALDVMEGMQIKVINRVGRSND